MELTGQTVLLIAVDTTAADAAADALARADTGDAAPWLVRRADSLEDALGQLAAQPPDVVLLATGSGDPVPDFQRVFRQCPLIPVVVLADPCRRDQARQTVSTGAQDYATTDAIEPTGLAKLLDAAALRHARLRQRMRASESAFKALFDCTEVGVVLVDTEGRILLSNPALATMLDCPAKQLRGMTVFQLIAPADRGPCAEAFQRFVDGSEATCRVEYRLARPAARTLWARTTASFVRAAEPRGDYVIYLVEDITARKQAEEKLRFQADILHNMTDWVTATDREGRITYVSRSVERILGYSPDELLGRPVGEAYVQQGTAPLPALGEPGDDGEAEDLEVRGEVTFFRKDGRPIVVSLHTSTLRDTSGDVIGLLSVARDITDRKEIERALELANAELIEKNKRLSELNETAGRFVDNVSHEFRTPLTVIKEFTSIVADGLGGPVTEDQAEYLQIVTGAVGDLAQMVDDLLDSSKLKAGTLRVDRRIQPVEAIVDAAWPLLVSKARAKQIELVRDIPGDLPEVFADAEKVGRVLINLVVNAVKFTPEQGRVTVSAGEVDAGLVSLGVTDTGPGMGPDELRVIFERFTQVGDVMGSSTKGFGLGLNIAKELVWLNLGDIDVTSRSGDGSTFRFTLPAGRAETICERYLARLDESIKPTLKLAALAVADADGDGDWLADEVQRLLASHSGAMDLTMPGAAGTLIHLVRNVEPAARIEQLQIQADKARQSGSMIGPLSIRPLGAWDWPGEADRARRALPALCASCDRPAHAAQPVGD